MADPTPAQRFGRRVAAERARRGWSMRQAAEGISASHSAIQRIENGQEVTLSTAVRVAANFGFELCRAVAPIRCEECLDMPPAGFTCNACGAEGGAAS